MKIDLKLLRGVVDLAARGCDAKGYPSILGCLYLSAEKNRLTVRGRKTPALALEVEATVSCEGDLPALLVPLAHLKAILGVKGRKAKVNCAELRLETRQESTTDTCEACSGTGFADGAHHWADAETAARCVVEGCNEGLIPVTREARSLLASVGGRSFEIELTYRVDDFPSPIALGEQLAAVDYGGVNFADRIGYVLRAASTNATRPHLCGVLFAAGGEIVAIDGHRLHADRLGAGLPDDELVGRGAIEAILAAAGGTTVHFAIGEKAIRFATRTASGIAVEVCANRNDSSFPPWKHVIPEVCDEYPRVEVASAALREALATASPFLDRSRLLRVTVETDAVRLATEGAEARFAESVEAETRGETFRLINATYLAEAINGSARCAIVFSAGAGEKNIELTPIVIRPVDSNDRLAVVMPGRL